MQNPIPFKKHNQFLLVIAIIFLLLIFFNVVLVNFFFALNIVPSEVIFFTAVCLSIVCSFLLGSTYFLLDWKFMLSGILSATALFILAKNHSENYYDVSWDGQAYHLEAIVRMIEGWNPIKKQLDNSAKAENIFINHYPRASWYSAFSFYLVSNKIESIKLFNYLWFFIAWSLCTISLNQFFKINFFIAFIIGLVASANPVVIYQSATNYVDGQIACGILTFILLSIFFFWRSNTGTIILMAVVISILVNYKFSVPFYLIVLAGGIILIFLFYRNRTALKKFITASLIGFVFGIGILGYSPYITNILQFQNPIYPLLERTLPEISKGIEETLQPASFENRNRVEKLFLATFSKGVWSRTPSDNILKMPGVYTIDEKLNYSRPDSEMAGFGPYFSLLLVVCFLIFPLIYFIDKKIFYVVLISIAITFISIFITNVGWLARYAPQFYIVPIIIITALFLLKKYWAYAIGGICLLVLIKNNYAIGDANYLYQKMYSRELKSHFKNLASRSDTVLVYFGTFQSNRIRLKEKKIKYQKVNSIEDLKTNSPQYFPWYNNTVATD